MDKAQKNVETIRKLMKTWRIAPLFARKGKNRVALLDVGETVTIRKEKSYVEMKKASAKIKTLVAENKELLTDKHSSDVAWNKYLEYIDEIVLNGLIRTVAVS